MTPTAAGVVTTPVIDDVREDLQTVERQIEDAYTAAVEQQLTAVADRIEAGVTAIERKTITRDTTRKRVADLERRVTMAYTTLVTDRLTTLDRRIEAATQDIKRATVAEEASATAARGRVGDLEARIEHAYTQTVELRLQRVEHRIDTAYRDIQADARVQVGQAEAKRLRIVVAALVGLLLLAAGIVLLLVL